VALKALAQRWRRWSAAAFERFIGGLPEVPEAEAFPGGPVARPGDAIYKSEPVARVLAAAAGRFNIVRRAAPAWLPWVAQGELLAAGHPPEVVRTLPLAQLSDWLELPSSTSAVIDATPATVSAAPQTAQVAREEVAPVSPPEIPAPEAIRESLPAPVAPPLHREPVWAEPGLPPWLADASETSHAGFFMLLNAWRAMGADEWLANHPQTRDAWLEDWAHRLALPGDDAQRSAWESPADYPLKVELARLRRATRRWLRSVARVGPASVVMRAGWVTITRTHVDMVLPLGAVDLRLRRAGLDQDPGWVPWLGRVVAFHYLPARGDS
jgi:hypothetical protein